MNKLALMVLVLVAECYCTPSKFSFGGKTEWKAAINATAGATAIIRRNEDGTSYVDAETIAAANVTGQASAVSYSGNSDNITSSVANAEGAIGIEAKPGLHVEEGTDKGSGPILTPRFSTNKFQRGNYSVRVVTGAPPRSAVELDTAQNVASVDVPSITERTLIAAN